MVAVTSVSMTPCATCEGRVPSRRTTPHPRWRVPGSTPSTIIALVVALLRKNTQITSGGVALTRAVALCGEDFAGIQEPLRVERALQAQLQIDELRRLLERQVGSLQNADAMLAREGAPHGDDIAKKLLDGAFDLGKVDGVVPQEVDVQVAVSRVAVGERANPGLFRGSIDSVEQIRNALSRHDDVFGELVPRESANGGGELAARGPKPAALGSVLGDEHVDRPLLRACLSHALDAIFAGVRIAIHLDEQERAGAIVDRQAAGA